MASFFFAWFSKQERKKLFTGVVCTLAVCAWLGLLSV